MQSEQNKKSDLTGKERLPASAQRQKPAADDRGNGGKGGRREIFRYPERIERVFTREDQDVYDMVEWVLRDVMITEHGSGRVVYQGKGLEFPSFWTETACKITASKYFKQANHYRETSLRQLVDRVADTITDIGGESGYFLNEEEQEIFRAELKFIMCDQRACFNSPVLFNIGIPGERPQASACFINSVKDDMRDISRLIVTESMIFKWGSGSGVNYSTLRSEKEPLSTGGTASGPLSFMKVLDANAGAIRSGGKSRRAAKMCVLNADHPDVEKFIDCKVIEEKKAQTLIEAGYDGSILGEAYTTVCYQNANHSVRVTDEFMKAVEKGEKWRLKAIVSGETTKEVEARALLRKMAEAAWITGDPGIQFDATTNDWHTCPKSGRINASNPCSEYVFLDESACNLASINLLKYVDEDGFQVADFAHTVRVMVMAQDILCGFAEYPTAEITRNSHDFRPLGLGYTNLGALLMVHGIGYDSEDGRHIAGAITALMCGAAYETSGQIARRIGPFNSYKLNAGPMGRVLDKHCSELLQIHPERKPPALFEEVPGLHREEHG